MDTHSSHKIIKITVKAILILLAILGHISAVLTIIGFCKDGEITKKMVINFLLALLTLALLVFIIAAVCIKKLVVKKKETLIKNYSGKLHYLIHHIRDELNVNALENNVSRLENFAFNACCEIEAIYKKLWNTEDVSVCIKRVIATGKETDDWEIKTLARSANVDNDRHEGKSTTVGENSDFKVILSPEYQAVTFACMDLNKVQHAFIKEFRIPYKNSTKDYLKKYQSTIVAPIRIESSKMNPKIQKEFLNIDYHIIGFLCIDTKKIFRHGTELKFDAGIEIAKATADSLYKIFESNILINEI